MRTEERLQLLAEIADQYYDQGLTQGQIARVYGYSRSAISRMLTEARAKNIVQIQVNYPLQRDRALEEILEHQHDLQSAFVLKRGGLTYRHLLRRLGRMGATYVIEQLHDDSILGISWGTTIFEVSNALTTARRTFDIEVIHMMGTIGKGDPFIEGHELVRSIANSLGGQYRELHSPLIVENQATQKALLNEPNITRNIGHGATCRYRHCGHWKHGYQHLNADLWREYFLAGNAKDPGRGSRWRYMFEPLRSIWQCARY